MILKKSSMEPWNKLQNSLKWILWLDGDFYLLVLDCSLLWGRLPRCSPAAPFHPYSVMWFDLHRSVCTALYRPKLVRQISHLVVKTRVKIDMLLWFQTIWNRGMNLCWCPHFVKIQLFVLPSTSWLFVAQNSNSTDSVWTQQKLPKRAKNKWNWTARAKIQVRLLLASFHRSQHWHQSV